MEHIITLTLASIVLAALAVAMGYILGWANQAFHVESDPKVEAINTALPGANCGGCGYVGCMEYAEAVAKGEADITLCGPGGAGCAAELARIMGIEIKDRFPYKAVVHCAASSRQRLKQHPYLGEATCAAANLVAGVQGCIYGCLGFGDCVAACAYDAIHIIDGLASVNYEKCNGCKACAAACPRNIISMAPFKSERVLVVACSNQDFGPAVKEVCQVGCIGCKACTRDNDMLTMQGNLPAINYDRYDPSMDFTPITDTCRMESLFFVGKPTQKDVEETKGEELPARVTADFETTVDETEWRG